MVATLDAGDSRRGTASAGAFRMLRFVRTGFGGVVGGAASMLAGAAVMGVGSIVAWRCGGPFAAARAEERPTVTATEATARLRESVTWLAAPDREGRGPGTKGIDAAAEWVAARFAEIGLHAPVDDGREQPFPMTLEATLGPEAANTAELVGPPGPDGGAPLVRLRLGTDFTPLATGGTGAFDLPLVFAGYGITAPAEHYDDYAPLAAGHRARGAALVVLRQEPQKDDPHGAFEGNQTSQHAALVRKVANASEHEAGAVIFCNDGAAGDELMAFTRAGEGSERRTMPVLHVRRALLDDIVRRSLGRDLAAIQKGIDDTLEPASAPLEGWRIRGRIAIDRVVTQGRNVLALLPGRGAEAAADRPAIDPRETVVLGAHYDHLGYGGVNSAAPGVTAVHHGADDNASGTALLVEVARRLAAAGPLPRSVLFIAFSGEERGLLGSGHYVANPLVPLADTVAMVNLDMVGRLDAEKIIVHGTGTASGFDPLVDRLAAAAGLQTAKEPGGFGPSDHSSFYAKKIPVLHLFTGSHADYHRPTDTAEKINYEGMERLADLVTDLVREVASGPRPEYREVASSMFARGGGDRPYFGSIPDFGKPGGGYALSGVAKDSPAARGGLRGGDVIVRLGDSAITGLEDFDSALRKHKGGETVPVVVRRDGADVRLEVVLGQPK
jgi:acetylornithine deacetylase/succinyl-diaminopimelate desuccinylase-like protein